MVRVSPFATAVPKPRLPMIRTTAASAEQPPAYIFRVEFKRLRARMSDTGDLACKSRPHLSHVARLRGIPLRRSQRNRFAIISLGSVKARLAATPFPPPVHTPRD